MKFIGPLLLLFCLCTAAPADEPPPVVWSKEFGFSGLGLESAVIVAQFVTAENDLISAAIEYPGGSGRETLFRIWKMTPAGNVVWEYLPPPPLPGSSARFLDGAAIDAEGAVWARGRGLPGQPQFLLKLDKNGSLMWEKVSDMRALGMAADEAGGVYLCGETGSQGSLDFVVRKFAPDGTVLWTRLYDGTAHKDDGAAAITALPGGGVAATGYTAWTTGGKNLITIRYLADGTPAWADAYDGPDGASDSGAAILADPAGNLTVAGISGNSLAVVRYPAAGGREWVQRADLTPYFLQPAGVVKAEYIHDAALDGTGRAGIIIRASSSARGDASLMAAFSPQGAVDWVHLHPIGNYGGLRCITSRPEGGFLAGGALGGSSGGVDSPSRLHQFSGSGVEEWFETGNARSTGVLSIRLGPAGSFYTAVSPVDTSTGNRKTVISLRGVPANAPRAVTEAAGDIVWRGAKLRGRVIPMGADGTWHFIYGPTTSYGSRTDAMPMHAADGEAPVSASVSSLSGGGSWHFRLVATTLAGSFFGDDSTFSTPLSPYQTWAAQKFGAHTAPGSALSADPDYDGWTNTFEYAFGGDPLSSGSLPGLPVPEMYTDSLSGLKYFSIVWEENPSSADILYTPEAAEDPIFWQSAALPGGNIVIQSLPGNRKRAIGAEFQNYLRLRIAPGP